MIWAPIVLGAVIVLFSAYTRNMQETTLAIGKKLAAENPLLPTGMQDAITPPWQTRNNILVMVGWGVYAIVCFVTLTWYVAILVLLLSFTVALSIATILLVPRPMSPNLVAKIRQNMEIRLTGYKQTGDSPRAAAMQQVLRRFDAAMGK